MAISRTVSLLVAVLVVSATLWSGSTSQDPGSFQGRYPCQCKPFPTAHKSCSAGGVARYTMTFNGDWTEPKPRFNRPQSWTSMIGASHSPCSVLWRQGGQASQGMQAMASYGVDSQMYHETRTRLDARTTFKTNSISSGVGSSQTTVELDRYHHVVSSMSFMQPSPDWFVGLDSVDLCRGDEWLPEATFQLNNAFDAGVRNALYFSPDKGGQYLTSVNRITGQSPLLSSSFLGFQGMLGNVTFKLQGVPQNGVVRAIECPVCQSSCNTRPISFECPANEIFAENAPQCPISCDHTTCQKLPQPGCACQPGFIRSTASPLSPCVSFLKCRLEMGGVGLPHVCRTSNEMRPECSSVISKGMKYFEACSERYSFSCPMPCDELRCMCLPGFMRNKFGECVVPSLRESGVTEAPPTPLGCKLELGESEQSDVSGFYEQTCPNNRDSTCRFRCEGGMQSCQDRCTRGCFCLSGLVRHRDGRCVSYSNCTHTAATTQMVEVTTPAATTAPAPRHPGLCPVDMTCAHFNAIGSGDAEGACCPTCRQRLSTCSNVQCPAVPGCLRYAETAEPGQCCLRCARLRKTISSGACSAVKCPPGHTCTVRDGQAFCTCKQCKGKKNTIRAPVMGKYGTEYFNTCHRDRQSCLTCTNLRP